MFLNRIISWYNTLGLLNWKHRGVGDGVWFEFEGGKILILNIIEDIYRSNWKKIVYEGFSCQIV